MWEAPIVTHLCFADSLVIFTKGLRRPLRSLFGFLESYELVSGQLISKKKSSFYASKHCTPSAILLASGIRISLSLIWAILFIRDERSMYIFYPLCRRLLTRFKGGRIKCWRLGIGYSSSTMYYNRFLCMFSRRCTPLLVFSDKLKGFALNFYGL